MDEDTIRIVTDDAPQSPAPDGSKMGIEDLGPYYFQDDEASKQKGKELAFFPVALMSTPLKLKHYSRVRLRTRS